LLVLFLILLLEDKVFCCVSVGLAVLSHRRIVRSIVRSFHSFASRRRQVQVQVQVQAKRMMGHNWTATNVWVLGSNDHTLPNVVARGPPAYFCNNNKKTERILSLNSIKYPAASRVSCGLFFSTGHQQPATSHQPPANNVQKQKRPFDAVVVSLHDPLPTDPFDRPTD